MTLESLARTIAKARHGTDVMWPNYIGAAEAVVGVFIEAGETAEPKREDLFTHFYHDADGIEDNAYMDPDDARAAFRAMLRSIIAQPSGAQ